MKALVYVKFDEAKDAFVKNVITNNGAWALEGRIHFTREEYKDGYFLLSDTEIEDAMLFTHNQRLRTYQRIGDDGYVNGNPMLGLCRREVMFVTGFPLASSMGGMKPFWAKRLGVMEAWNWRIRLRIKAALEARTTKD